MAVTPDGRHVVSGSGGTLRVWDLKDGKEILKFTLDAIVTACIAAQDDRIIVAGDGFGRVHFLRLVEADKTKPAICDTKTSIPLSLFLSHAPARNRRLRPMSTLWATIHNARLDATKNGVDKGGKGHTAAPRL